MKRDRKSNRVPQNKGTIKTGSGEMEKSRPGQAVQKWPDREKAVRASRFGIVGVRVRIGGRAV